VLAAALTEVGETTGVGRLAAESAYLRDFSYPGDPRLPPTSAIGASSASGPAALQ